MPTRQRNTEIRAGQFRHQLADATTPKTIIKVSGSRSYYRLFNAGRVPVRVSGTPGGGVDVQPACSLDFRINGDVTVNLLPAAINKLIQGLYEDLQMSEIRSGRFELPAPASTATVKLVDVSVPAGPAPQLRYRFYNTGQAEFNLSLNGTLLGAVEPECSLDFEIPRLGNGAGATTREIELSHDQQVEGIYEVWVAN